MKNILKARLSLLFAVCFQIFVFAQNTAQLAVKGNCEMCKATIEKVAKKAGATSAVWDIKTKTLQVNFNIEKTSIDHILKNIANAGYDNQKYTAPTSVYTALPACCHYRENPEHHATKTSFLVKGSCGMCKTRIEDNAKKAGATTAVWNAETQLLTLDTDAAKNRIEEILKQIANAGHDNEKYQAPDEVYNNLPGCCLYNRASTSQPTTEHSKHQHSAEETQPSSALEKTPVDKLIEGVTLTKYQAATAIDSKSAGLTFNIGEKELLKAACCNLSESFETNATVDVSFSNAVTGTKQLKMLGLDQKYTSLTKELLPEIRGLATPYGLNFIPGRWIGSIQLTKGGSTVTNSYESITGQINTELVKFQKEPETTLNVFADNNARTEANITHTSTLGEDWNHTILLHGNGTLAKMDYNHDGFLDQPTGTQINMAYLLNYNDLDHTGWGSHFGINFLQDKRKAGQMDFNHSLHPSQQNAYGVGIDISRFQIWNKTGHIFKGKPYQSIGWMNQFTYHQQNSFFGQRFYDGKQTTFYSNLIFESIFGNTNHKYKTGASFLYDRYNESYLYRPIKRSETVPGLFFEYTLTGSRYTLVAGARTDFHNLAGTQLTPRLNFKYDFTKNTILRLSAGRGFRTANIFAESQGFFASNRAIEIKDNGGNIYGLKPEIAWNYGASLQQDFKFLGRKSTIIADIFRTDFKNQVLLDLDQSPNKIVFYNLEGKSFAKSFQTQWDFIPFRNFEVRMAYKYYDVQADFEGGRRAVPFMAKHRGFFNIGYSTTKNNKGRFWNFDTTLNLVGKQKLPNLNSNPTAYQLPEYSNSYATLNAQIAKHFNDNIRVYLGGENLTSTRQNNPIIDAQNPFSNYFDGGMIYAPIMPAMLYVGADFKF